MDFNSAVLSEANLHGANLEDADFTEAYLCGVDLSQVLNLTCDQLELAYLDRDTRLPDYLKITWVSDTPFVRNKIPPQQVLITGTKFSGRAYSSRFFYKALIKFC